MMVNEESLSFGLLLGKKKQFEAVALGSERLFHILKPKRLNDSS